MFHDAASAIKRAAESMARVHEHMVAAHEHVLATTTAFGEAIDALVTAHDEHEDLRETVRRLELLVIQLVDEKKRLIDPRDQ
jgi:hypothetical protein